MSTTQTPDQIPDRFYVISMEFLSLRRGLSSWRNVASGKLIQIYKINDVSRWLCENCKITDFSRRPFENYKVSKINDFSRTKSGTADLKTCSPSF